MTPAQFAACSDVFDNERRIEDAQFAYTRLLLIEPHRDKKKKSTPYTADDFALFGEKAQKQSEQKRETQTWQGQKSYVENFLHPFFVARANLEDKIKKGE